MANKKRSPKRAYQEQLRTIVKYQYQLRRYNLRRFRGIVPSRELVLECVKKSGLSNYRFEIVYKIARGRIMKYLKGSMGMPLHYWHIFYEFDHLDVFYALFKQNLADLIYKRRIRAEEKKRLFKQLRMEYRIHIPITTMSNKNIIDAFRKSIDNGGSSGQ